jgi:hypothetical protein
MAREARVLSEPRGGVQLRHGAAGGGGPLPGAPAGGGRALRAHPALRRGAAGAARASLPGQGAVRPCSGWSCGQPSRSSCGAAGATTEPIGGRFLGILAARLGLYVLRPVGGGVPAGLLRTAAAAAGRALVALALALDRATAWRLGRLRSAGPHPAHQLPLRAAALPRRGADPGGGGGGAGHRARLGAVARCARGGSSRPWPGRSRRARAERASWWWPWAGSPPSPPWPASRRRLPSPSPAIGCCATARSRSATWKTSCARPPWRCWARWPRRSGRFPGAGRLLPDWCGWCTAPRSRPICRASCATTPARGSSCAPTWRPPNRAAQARIVRWPCTR